MMPARSAWRHAAAYAIYIRHATLLLRMVVANAMMPDAAYAWLRCRY